MLMLYIPTTPSAFVAVNHEVVGVVGSVLGKARNPGYMAHWRTQALRAAILPICDLVHEGSENDGARESP